MILNFRLPKYDKILIYEGMICEMINKGEFNMIDQILSALHIVCPPCLIISLEIMNNM